MHDFLRFGRDTKALKWFGFAVAFACIFGSSVLRAAEPAPTPADATGTQIGAAAASTLPTPLPGRDPLGQLIVKLGSDSPADSASIEPARAPTDTSIDLWERIRRGFKMPDLETRAATDRTRWYAGQPDYIDRMTGRASRYLFHIVDEIEKRGMPTELALLPFVESAMQPEAESHAKASGLWQFIPSTGKLYQLEQNLWRDERRDVVESTRAALDYLQKLYSDFGDWHLALAAYNCGEGCVGKAVARNRARRKPTDFSSLKLPNETRYYVPKLQAIKNIVREPARHRIALPAIRNEPYFVVVRKTRDIDIITATRLADMQVDEFQALNPSFNRPVMVGAAQSRILLPADHAETFIANLAAYESTGQPLASWTTYVLRSGETIEQLAERVGITDAALREANRVPPKFRLAPGSTILIPRDETMDEDIAPEKLDAVLSLVPERANLRRITYRVRRGDSLNSVARRWGVQTDDIVAWNRLRTRGLFAGQRLNLMVEARPAGKPKIAGGKAKATRTAARAK